MSEFETRDARRQRLRAKKQQSRKYDSGREKPLKVQPVTVETKPTIDYKRVRKLRDVESVDTEELDNS